MFKNYRFFFYSALAMIFMLGTISLFAENDLKPPVNLEAKAITGGNSGAAQLDWQKNPDGTAPGYFLIYMSKSGDEDFKRIMKVEANDNKEEYSAEIKNLENGKYSFYVTSALKEKDKEKESEPSEKVSVEIKGNGGGKYHIKITSNPETKLELGDVFEYEPEAETNAPEDCPVKYSVESEIDGLYFDEATGSMTWTPEKEGNYDIDLTAYLSCDESVKTQQKIKIMVKGNGGQKYFVKIKSASPIKLEVGEDMELEVEAETNAPENCPVLYELSDGPDGMYIDENTGSLTWTPEKSGNFEFAVKAYLDCDNNVKDQKEFKVMVGGGGQKYHLKITSKPDMFVHTWENWEYNLKAETNAPEDCPVKFELDEGPEGMELVSTSTTFSPEESYSLTWSPEKEGHYYVKVKAYLECDEGVTDVQAFKIFVDSDKQMYVKMTSHRENFGEVGEMYKYDIKYKTNADEENCPVIFELDEDAPDGMEIVKTSSTFSTEESYSITWTPEEPGVYKTWLYAHLDCSPNVKDKERIVINVKKKATFEPCAVIYGTVQGSDSSMINEGKVKIWRVDGESDNDDYKPVYDGEITDGEYKAEVSQGTYLVMATADGYKTEWYDNADVIDSASKIEVECDNEYQADFELDALTEPSSATFSGRVTSSDEGTGVKSLVSFMPSEWIYNDHGRPKHWKYVTETDTNGNYEITVPGEHKYIAMAVPEPESGYAVQYYNLKSDPLEADLIDASSTFSSTFTVDFVLEPSNEASNGIKGTVTDMDGNTVEAWVVAYLTEPKEDSVDNQFFAQYAETDEDGNFIFSNMIPGKYVLLSIPKDRAYVPGYYRDSEAASLKWKLADEVEVDQSVVEGINIMHRLKNGNKGIAKMKGKIKKNKKAFKKITITPQGVGEGLPGAFVYALDENGEVIEYSVSENSGDFQLDNVPEGKYTLVADKIGFDGMEDQVTVEYAKDVVLDLDLQLIQDPTDAQEPNTVNLRLFVYPVPASDYTNIELDSYSGRAYITVTDMSGRVVYTDDTNVSGGNNTYTLNTSMLPSGNYLVTVTVGGIARTISLPVVR